MLRDRNEVEAFFLNHDDPVVEEIQEAETFDEAEGLAADYLADAEEDYDPADLAAVVRKLWEDD